MRRSGFTLLEIVFTILLVGIVSTLSIVAINQGLTETQFENTVRELEEIRVALVGNPRFESGGSRSDFGYQGDLGGIPTAGQGLAALTANPGLPAWSINTTARIGMGWNGPYLVDDDSDVDHTTDAWGNAYVYSPAATPPTIVSLGADGAVGGTGFDADITVELGDYVRDVNVYGFILQGGVQWSGDAEVELNEPDGSGALSQTIDTVVAGDNGAFSFSGVSPGLRSLTIYVPDKATATTTLGPVIFAVDAQDFLVPTTLTDLPGGGGPATIDLEVPIEMIDNGISSNTSAITFSRTRTSLDTTAYDGSIVYRFEAVCTNSSGSDEDVELYDSSDASVATLTIPGSTSNPTRFVTTFTPTAGSDNYRVRLAATGAANDLTCYTARMLVAQTGATITRIYIPLTADDASSGADNDNTMTGNHIDTTNTVNTYQQVNPEYFSVWTKDESRYATIPSTGSPWTLEGVCDSTGGNCKIALFNKTTGSSVTETTGCDLSSVCSKDFGNGTANFTDGNDFEVRVKRQGGPASRVYYFFKAGLWVNLTNLSKAEVYYRASKYFQASSDSENADSRVYIDTSRFSNPTVYHEAVGYHSVAGLSNLTLTTQGSSDSSTGGASVAASTFNPASSSKTIGRSGALTITSGDRFLAKVNRTLGTFSVVSSLIVVSAQ